MTKNELIAQIVDVTGHSRDHVSKHIEMFLNLIMANVDKGKTIEIRGFGNFLPRTLISKTDGVRRRKVVFRHGMTFKNILNGETRNGK